MLRLARDFGVLIVAFLFAQQGYADAFTDYKSGLEKFQDGDVVSAMPPLKKAADAGQADAQALLAFILHQAGENETAAQYYRKSAEQGNAEGQYGYAMLFLSGDGVAKNPAEARKWLELAAKQGSSKGVSAMAELYMNGTGVDPDSSEALPWIKRAADANFIPAISALAAAYRSGKYGLAIDPAQAAQLDARVRKLRGLKDEAAQNKD